MNLDKEIFEIELKDIMPNRFQPREVFDDSALQELSQSIKEHGVIQPILVRKVGDKYEIIAGERRYRASQLAGKETIPAMVTTMDDREAAKVALIENLQRKDLSAIEEAKTYQTILKLDNMTQEELAQSLGKSQSAIANKLRLLNLDDTVQAALLNNEISERHARSLLNLPNKEDQKNMLNEIIANRMTVRQLDDEIARRTGKSVQPEIKEDQANNINNVEDISNDIGISYNIPDINKQNINNYENSVSSIEPLQNEIPSNEIKDDIPVENTVKEEPVKQQINLFDALREKGYEEQASLNSSIEEIKPVEEPITPIIEEQKEITPIETKPETISNSISNENINKDVYDIRFAINNFRQAVQNTEKFGFKVNVMEADLEGSYQIVININKNKE